MGRWLQLLSSFSDMMEDKNPTLARFYRSQVLEISQRENIKNCPISLPRTKTVCPFCGELNKGDSFRIRVLPKRRYCAKVKNILIKVEGKHPLTKGEQKYLASYKKSTARVVAKCLRCGKKQFTKAPGRFKLKQKQIEIEKANKSRTNKLFEKEKRIERQKEKRRQKQKKYRERLRGELRELDSGVTVHSNFTKTSSGLDATLGSPVLSSTPKPSELSTKNLSKQQNVKKREQPERTLASVMGNQDSFSEASDKKSTKRRQTASPLLDNSITLTGPNVKKRKTKEDIHLHKSFREDNDSSSPSNLSDLTAEELSELQNTRACDLSDTTVAPVVSLWNQGHFSKESYKKSTKQRLSGSPLLDDSFEANHSKNKKKKTTKDMHLQLQKLFGKDKKSNKSTSSLKDFLSSV